MKVIFTHLKPDVWQYKVASSLKSAGVKTVSISLKSHDKELFQKAFSEIICLDLPDLKPKTLFLAFMKNPFKFFSFFSKIIRIKADAAIIQGPPLYLTSFFLWFFRGRFPRIFFPYDTNYPWWKNPEKHISKIEILREKYSFKNCDAILIKDYPGELKLLPSSWEANKKPLIEFRGPLKKWFVNYNPKEKLSYKDGEIHIAYPGSLALEDSQVILMSHVREALKQKIHFHIYPNPKPTEKEINSLTQNNSKLRPYLHIHDYVSPEKLSQEMSKYDFGLCYGDIWGELNSEIQKYTFGNRISSYWESSIPIIVQEGYDSTTKEVSKNHLGIICKDMKNIKKHIKNFNYEASIKDIVKYRNEKAIEKNIDSFIKFIKNLNKK